MATTFLLALLAVTPAIASLEARAAGMWQQCGGLHHTGDTDCVDGAYCSSQNPWYCQ